MIQLPSFHRYAFVYLFTLFTSGIVVSYFFDNTFAFYITVGISLATLGSLLLLKKKEQLGFWLLIACSMFVLGNLRLQFFNEQLHPKKTQDKHFLLIREFQQKEGWSKGVGQIMLPKDGKLEIGNQKILFFVNTSKKLHINDVISVYAELTPIQNKNNPGEFNMQLFGASKELRKCFFSKKRIIN